MLRFIKGDPENLLGRSVIYAVGGQDNYDSSNTMSSACFVAETPEDIVNMIRSYKRNFPLDVGKILRSNADEINSKLPEMKITYNTIIHPFYFEDFNVDAIDSDVIRLLDVEDARFIPSMLDFASNLYMATYLARRRPYRSQLNQYDQLETGDFARQAIGLTQQILRSVEDGCNYDRHESDLRQITKGAPFQRDVDGFFEAAKSRDTELMLIYSEKMFAIVFEDFEKAEKLKLDISSRKTTTK